MTLEIITPDEQVSQGDIESIRVLGKQGSFEVLKNHAAIVSSLEVGEVTVRTPKGEKHTFHSEAGVIEVLDQTSRFYSFEKKFVCNKF